MIAVLPFFLSVVFAGSVFAKDADVGKLKTPEIVWKDPKGKILENIPERKSKNGFGGWIILTDDLNWEKEWNTHSGYMPKLRQVTEMKRGKITELLITFSNPKADSNSNSTIKTDVVIVKPDGKVDIIQTNNHCFSGKAPKNRGIAMCESAVTFITDDTDPLGTWKFEVLLKDVVGGTILDLSTSFKIK
ncbi:hypothetical protein [Bdellovibrio bacteriovorus]|uniref:hypothetical protein n=1 Tax=Bdellovibrio bacteriovorus TaxID=959 RepID=UPI003AA94918